MLYLPIHLLEPGMTLASEIPSANSRIPLVRAGQKLTKELLANLYSRGVQGLYIENELSDDIEVEEFITPELRHDMLCTIKQEFQRVLQRNTPPDAQAVNQMAGSIVTSVLKHQNLMLNMIDVRDYDNYTYYHSINVGVLAAMIGVRLKLPVAKLRDLSIAGLLHDIGKIEIPISIIDKPGPLTDEEFALVKEHPSRAVDRLKDTREYSADALDGIAAHHEMYAGGGYPKELAGSDIPFFGRILAVADVYDALSSKRSYREAWEPCKIIEYIMSRSDMQFDPGVLSAFLRVVVAYPIGTMVQLSDDSMGVVVRNHPSQALRPVVRLLYPESRRQSMVDLSTECLNVTITGMVDHLPPNMR